MQRHHLFLPGSAVLLVISFVLLPVFEIDTPFNPRTAVPSACTTAGGLILSFLAARRLLRWWCVAACLLLPIHGLLFARLLSSIHSHLAVEMQ
jgi:hypothetical protein